MHSYLLFELAPKRQQRLSLLQLGLKWGAQVGAACLRLTASSSKAWTKRELLRQGVDNKKFFDRLEPVQEKKDGIFIF